MEMFSKGLDFFIVYIYPGLFSGAGEQKENISDAQWYFYKDIEQSDL